MIKVHAPQIRTRSFPARKHQPLVMVPREDAMVVSQLDKGYESLRKVAFLGNLSPRVHDHVKEVLYKYPYMFLGEEFSGKTRPNQKFREV